MKRTYLRLCCFCVVVLFSNGFPGDATATASSADGYGSAPSGILPNNNDIDNNANERERAYSAFSESSSTSPRQDDDHDRIKRAQAQFKAQAQAGIRDTLHIMSKHSTLAGSLKPAFQKLLLTKDEAMILRKSIAATADVEDLVCILMVGWALLPLLKWPYDALPFAPKKPFEKSRLHLLATQLQQVARIALAVYLVDILKMILIGLGYEYMYSKMSLIPHAFAQSSYCVWIASRIILLKRHLIQQYSCRHPESYGRLKLVNRLLDAAVYVVTAFTLVGICKFEMGLALHSIVALFSASTLAIGLASQGILSQLLHGLLLASSDRIYEGDKIRFGDKNGQNIATIVKMGWMDTVLRDSDEVMRTVSNADLAKTQISNLSRVRYSRVKQTLRFKYKESSKIPALLKTIKQEIQLACPLLIQDGSRPFRAHWTNYGPDYLEVVVDAHFKVKPIGDVYWDNRQRVLQAIHRAVMINQVEFATP